MVSRGALAGTPIRASPGSPTSTPDPQKVHGWPAAWSAAPQLGHEVTAATPAACHGATPGCPHAVADVLSGIATLTTVGSAPGSTACSRGTTGRRRSAG